MCLNAQIDKSSTLFYNMATIEVRNVDEDVIAKVARTRMDIKLSKAVNIAELHCGLGNDLHLIYKGRIVEAVNSSDTAAETKLRMVCISLPGSTLARKPIKANFRKRVNTYYGVMRNICQQHNVQCSGLQLGSDAGVTLQKNLSLSGYIDDVIKQINTHSNNLFIANNNVVLPRNTQYQVNNAFELNEDNLQQIGTFAGRGGFNTIITTGYDLFTIQPNDYVKYDTRRSQGYYKVMTLKHNISMGSNNEQNFSVTLQLQIQGGRDFN